MCRLPEGMKKTDVNNVRIDLFNYVDTMSFLNPFVGKGVILHMCNLIDWVWGNYAPSAIFSINRVA